MTSKFTFMTSLSPQQIDDVVDSLQRLVEDNQPQNLLLLPKWDNVRKLLQEMEEGGYNSNLWLETKGG